MTQGSSPRRGRRPGQIPDLPPPEGHSFNAETRVAWLLRSWRLAVLPDSSARGFAAQLVDRGVSADASRVSRWETGQIPAPLEVVEGYEGVVHLPPGALLSLATYLRRLASGSPVPRIPYAPDRFSPPILIEELLDQVLDGEPTGRDWFELGMCVSATGSSLTLPRSVWRAVTDRLVTQLGVSVGTAYLCRAEAAILVGTHHSGQRALVNSIGEAITHPDSMLVIDPMSLLQEMADPPANLLVVRLLDHPSPSIRNASQWAATVKLGRGHFRTDDLHLLERALARILQDDELAERGAARLPDLVAALPENSRDRLRRTSRVTAAGLERLATKSAAPAPAPASTPASASTPTGKFALNLAQDADIADDPMFERIVETALGHPGSDRRFAAAFLLRSSPWCAELAHACLDRVRQYAAGRNPADREQLHRTMVLLSIIGTDAERRPLTHLVEFGPEKLRPLALFALAHLPPAPADASPLPLKPLLVGDDEGLARAALYCAGMTADPALADIEDDESVADWRRRAARWWRRNGPAIHELEPLD